ncbi:hypothetical protein TYRP_001149 [Tyrophagus putrescentiae]|nr:hypothetical protein TYRP_001149 [Tyrophagus putrescentiae]
MFCKVRPQNHILWQQNEKYTLTDVIWLIGIDRWLGAQLASSLCPEPSVPINQMTPAFNIWGYLAAK